MSSKSSGELPQLTKREEDPTIKGDNNLLNNILPSYHMFQSTVSTNLTPSQENFRVDPPIYEVTPVTSNVSTASLLQSGIQSPNSEFNDDRFPFPPQEHNVFDEASAGVWENTVLANVHKLTNLTNSDNEISKDLHIDIKVTEKVCQKGVAPTIYDPSKVEFKQGDYIHGYITIQNKSTKPISFDMVYIVFEGVTTVLENEGGLINTQKPYTTEKFLSMLDLFASWSYANIARLVTDDGDPHDWCEGETDPYDNTVLSIDVKRFFQPHETYKRYFTFRIPEKLLDVSCKSHNLAPHIQLPPSLGTSSNLDPPSVILSKRESNIRDLSFIDTSVNYSVEARIIGRASEYGCDYSNGDRYVVAQEAICPIRVIPKPDPEYNYHKSMMMRNASLNYDAFRRTINEKLELARSLCNLPSDQRLEMALSPVVSRNTAEKLNQLYHVADNTIKLNLSKNRKQFNDEIYQCLVPFKKKTLTGSSKILGIVSLSTPKQEYCFPYIPPTKFRTNTYDTKMTIPLELSYFQKNNAGKTLPEIKSCKVDLVVLTIRSRKYPIPIEFSPDMCFNEQIVDDRKKEIDNFDSLIIKQFRNDLHELTTYLKQLGNDLLKIEANLFKDLKSLAGLSTKYINLALEAPEFHSKSSSSGGVHKSLQSMPWKLEEQSTNEHNLYSKNFNILLDLKSCHLKAAKAQSNGFDSLTLVPSFQSCLIARLYYLKLNVKLSNGESLTVNIPVTIEN